MKPFFTFLNSKQSPLFKLSAAFVCLMFSTSAFSGFFDQEYDEKNWKEIAFTLPAFPDDANLIPFKVGAVTDTQFMIDGQSISIDADDVIRFTLVIISSAGARTISYEGIRCGTVERRAYAFGRSDKTWSKAKNNDWKRISGGENQYSELHGNYFCVVGESALKSPEDARRALTMPSRRIPR